MKTLIVAFILAAMTVVAGDAVNDTNQAPLTLQKSLGKEGDAKRAAYFLEASKYDAKADAWLMERFKVAKTIKVGSTYAELLKYFRGDGGPNGNGGRFRFDMISCPSIKIDVQLADKDGNRVKGSIFDIIPADATVTKISKPYLEEPIGQ
jgi:hypothetical protein